MEQAADVRDGPLAGFRIIEFCSTVSGPFATMLLADQGADVIKVEPPGGDQSRHIGDSRAGVRGMASMYLNTNRNKRSVVLDLKKPADVDRAAALCAGADVVVQNFRPGVMERLGLGHERLRAANPALVYVSISGLGDHPLVRGRRVYDIVPQGLSGFCAVQADRQTGEPRTVQTVVVDKIASLTVWQGVTAALLHRVRSGEGQHVEVNMLSAALTFLWPEALPGATLRGDDVRAGGSVSGVQYVYRTADGHILTGHVADGEFAACCRALEIEDVLTDKRFADIGLRMRNAEALNRIFAEVLITRPSAHWLQRLADQDAVYAPVNTPQTLPDDPVIAALGLLEEHEHEICGPYRQPVHPIRFSATPAAHRRGAPMLGEDNRAVLGEIAGTAVTEEGTGS